MTDAPSASAQTQTAAVRPYELLIRYDSSGAITGAHAQNQLVITSPTGGVLGVTLQAPTDISVAAQQGFPVGDVLPQVQAGAVAAMEAAQASLAQAQAQITALQQQLGEAQAAAGAYQAQAAALQQQLAALQRPKVPGAT